VNRCRSRHGSVAGCRSASSPGSSGHRGVAPHRFLLRMRVRQAELLLRTGSLRSRRSLPAAVHPPGTPHPGDAYPAGHTPERSATPDRFVQGSSRTCRNSGGRGRIPAEDVIHLLGGPARGCSIRHLRLLGPEVRRLGASRVLLLSGPTRSKAATQAGRDARLVARGAVRRRGHAHPGRVTNAAWPSCGTVTPTVWWRSAAAPQSASPKPWPCARMCHRSSCRRRTPAPRRPRSSARRPTAGRPPSGRRRSCRKRLCTTWTSPCPCRSRCR